MSRVTRTSLTAAGLAATLISTAGCQHVEKIDKAGSVRPATRVITLEMADGGDADSAFFAQDVARRSHGTLKVSVDSTTYDDAIPTSELRLAAALRAGRVGFSYQPARDWAAAGVASFQALDAPFLITTDKASEALATSQLARVLLRSLSRLGMVGIGLIPSQPRQILSTRPLFAPSSFDGLRLRIVNNPQTAALGNALGARPVQNLSAEQVGTGLSSGSIGAVETSAMPILSNSYNADATYLTSYGLFPKFDTIVATRTAWATLTAAQQTAMKQAAADTLAHSREVPSTEDYQDQQLCRDGLVIDEPAPSQLAALARESQRALPASAAVSSMVAKIRVDIPGTGPRAQAIPLPYGCHVAHSVAQARSLHRLSVPRRSSDAGGPTFPAGTYVTNDTVADFRALGQTGPDWNRPVTFTWRLRSNGSFLLTQKPDFPDAGPGGGHYEVKGNEVTFIWNPALGLTNTILRWSYFEGELTFAVVDVQDTGLRVQFSAHPWRRVE